MLRSSLVLTTLLSLAAPAAAQCLSASSPGTTLGSGDDVLFGPVAMGITFPLAGAAGPLTHCVVSSNGVLYLTSGGAAVDAAGNHYGNLPSRLSGIAGASPRVAPYWSDLVLAGPAGFVAIDTSVAGRCAVTWVEANEFLQAPKKSFQAELFSTGVVRFSYSAGMASDGLPALVGVSVGNAAGLPPASDLSAGPTTATGITFEAFDALNAPFDLPGAALTFTPSGAGFQVATTCAPAAHTTMGSGCYAMARESFYQFFPTAAAAAAALNGQSMRLVPTATGYSATWGGGSYVAPPVSATTLAPNDDDEAAVVLPSALPVPGGGAPVLYVHTNGFVSTAFGNDNGAWNSPAFNDYMPSPQFRNAPAAAFWSWHDYTPVQGGRIKHHQAVVGSDTIFYVTWDAVESYAVPETTNPSTFQFQFNLTSGAVTYVWQSLTAIGTGQSPFLPESHLIGYSPCGASLDPGSVTLATALPLSTGPDLLPLALTAAPAPVINPSTVVTYTATNLPEFVPLSGVHLATLFLSVNPLPGGADLGFLGAPNCASYLVTLDLDLGGQLTFAPTAAWNLTYDNVLFAPGNVIGAQAVALITPNSLPNGQNAFGLTVSNGVRSYVNAF